MRYSDLALFRHRLAAGVPLPFNVFDEQRTLLLAKGHVVQGQDQLDALLNRGTLVDLAELHRSPNAVRQAPPELLPALWADQMERLGQTLAHARASTFRAALDEAAEPVAALIERDPDLAIFQVLRQENAPRLEYGLTHSMHTAIVTRLVAQRLGWLAGETTRAFKAALTMNLSMLELQGVLAVQATPPTDEQRRAIHTHPMRSREMLELAGVLDRDWLDAVEQHHEEPDGSGYPTGCKSVHELASLLSRADVYTAKLSARANRDALPADRAAREIFMRDPSHPVNAALVKELGVYPPGCFVTLASGETGIVVKRGTTVMHPVVAAITNRRGQPWPEPQRRDTSERVHHIVGVLAAKDVKAPLVAEKLAVLA